MRWPLTGEWDPTAASWIIEIITPDSAQLIAASGYSGAAGYSGTNVKKEDRILYYNMISDGSEPVAIYELLAGKDGYSGNPNAPGFSGFSGYSGFTNKIGFPCVYFVTLKTGLSFQIIREMNESSVTQLSYNRFLVTWWSNFYNEYDIEKEGYTDDLTKMIRSSNTTRPTTEYKKVMLSAFAEFKPTNIHIMYPGSDVVSHFYNVFFPVFTKPAVINTMTVLNESVGSADMTIVQAVDDGRSGYVKVKPIIMNVDAGTSPNFTQVGRDPMTVGYFKL